MTGLADSDRPTTDDLLAVAAHAQGLADPATASDAVWSWNQDLYDHAVVDVDYDMDASKKRLLRGVKDRTLIASSNLEQIRGTMTFLSRAERFCDGWLEEYAKNGVIADLCARLGVLATDMPRDELLQLTQPLLRQ